MTCVHKDDGGEESNDEGYANDSIAKGARFAVNRAL